MTESVEYYSRVYPNSPLVYGNEDAIILTEENTCRSDVSNFYARSARGMCFNRRPIRVILGRFGQIYKMSAPQKDVVTEGQSPYEAWAKFLVEISKRKDASLLIFDVGPTRRDEIVQGLNAPEDEDWDELIINTED